MASHRRRSTEERIALAIESSSVETAQELQESKPKGEQDWACLECTFINAAMAQACAMCFHPRPSDGSLPMGGMGNLNETFVAQPTGPTVASNMMYGSVPPPAASQITKREQPKKTIGARSHRRMTTEEQITLAIQQSAGNEMDDMFQTDEKKQADPTHQRMTTAEQINRAIMMSDSGNDDVHASSGGAGPAAQDPVGHRRMSTEEQIASAINETVAAAPEEEMTDEDRINQAIANMGIGMFDAPKDKASEPQGGHKRMSTEEQIKRAIYMSSGEEETFLSANTANAAMPFHSAQQDQYMQQIVENPENYGTFEPPQGVNLDVRGLHMVKFILSALNDKKQEINKLRLQLNKERVTSRDLRFELEIIMDKHGKLEEELQNKDQELKEVIAKQAENFIEKAVSAEDDTFVAVEPAMEKQGRHQKEPSYGGIRELFMEGDDVSKKVEKKSEHVRDPTYGGIREMFQDSNQTPDQISENQNVDAGMKKTHEREPSYMGMTELFSRPAEDEAKIGQATQGHEQAKQESRQQERVGQQHDREPSYGGIRDMFSTPDDLEEDNDTGKEEEENVTKDKRHLSYGGIRQMFAEEDDDIGHAEENEEDSKGQGNELTDIPVKEQAEEPEESHPDSFEEEIEASYDVIWNLLVEKVHHPQKYLPVEDVAVEHRDGRWVRHMFLTPMDLVITEEISVNEDEHMIKFVDNNYPDLEIVNALERTDDPKKQRVVFYKQNRETGMKIASAQLTQMFTTDAHFLKQRAAQKMARAAHAREPSYGGIAGLFSEHHSRNVSYGGVGDMGGMNFVIAQQPAINNAGGSGRHSREMSLGGIRTMFENQDKPQLMARLQEEVFKVMDSYEWSEITKGMVVQEVEQALGFALKAHHKRFIKITIMRIIDGRLKLECFAGETVKKEVVEMEKAEEETHKREISYGGVQEQNLGEDDWQRKEVEFDEHYSKAQERELDQLYDKAQTYSKSAQAVIGGGFKSKIQRDHEKEVVRRTQRHSRNVSYGGVRYSEEDPAQKILDDIGPEVHVVENSGFAEKVQTLTTQVEELTKENGNLKLLTENMTKSKFVLVQTCSNEIERLRHIISSLS